MCNAFKELEAEWMERRKTEGIKYGIEQGVEYLNSVKYTIISMLEFGVTKEQILTRYSKEDLEKAEAAIAYK